MKRVQNNELSGVRGFNYQPSHGGHGVEIWGPGFDAAAVARDLALARELFPGMNTIRLWLSHDAYLRHGGACAARFEAALAAADGAGLRVIPVLFNGWHSFPDFGGISFEQIEYFGRHRFDLYSGFIEAMVRPHQSDPRILMWDLCNEPMNSLRVREHQDVCMTWMRRVYAACKEAGASAPLCVGSTPDMGILRLLEPVSDVLTPHPYFAWNSWVPERRLLAQFLDEAVDFANECGKAMVATETGWGALDDAKRAAILEAELEEIVDHGLGFTIHLLCHTLVADGHRPEYGPITNAGYMACIERDGTLRPHHGFINRFMPAIS